jgi:hypothetical protein
MTEVLRHDYKMSWFCKKTTKVKIVSFGPSQKKFKVPLRLNPQPPREPRVASTVQEFRGFIRRFKLLQTLFKPTIPAARRLKRWQHEAAPLPLGTSIDIDRDQIEQRNVD